MKWHRLYKESYEDIQAKNDKYEWEKREYPQQRKLKDFIGNELDKIFNKVWDYYMGLYGDKDGEKVISKFQSKFDSVEEKMMEFIDSH